MKLHSLLLAAGLAGLSVTHAEDAPTPPVPVDAANLRTFTELVRNDVRAVKALLLAQNLSFTEDEAVVFWPLYREYDLELGRLYDRRHRLVQDYVKMADTLTDRAAAQLADDVLKLEEDRTKLKRKYFKSFTKAVGAKKSAQFFQIENQLNAAIDLRLAAALPLIR